MDTIIVNKEKKNKYCDEFSQRFLEWINPKETTKNIKELDDGKTV